MSLSKDLSELSLDSFNILHTLVMQISRLSKVAIGKVLSTCRGMHQTKALVHESA